MPIARHPFAAASVFLAIAIILFYVLFGLPIEFFQAESGLILAVSLQKLPVSLSFLKSYALHSYNGHYTPIAFTAELLQSKLFGGNESFWFVRQSIGMTCLAVGILFFALQTASKGVNRPVVLVAAVASSLIVVLNVTMAELFSWPFMFLQMLCMALSAFAGGFAVRFVSNGTTRDAWWATGLGYASMHFLGVGLATSVMTLTIIAGATALLWRRKAILMPLTLFAGLTTVHAALMVQGQPSPGAMDPAALSYHFLVLYGVCLFQAVRYLAYPENLPWPDFNTTTIVASLTFDVAIFGIAVWLILLTLTRPRWRSLGVAALFALLLHGLIVALIVAREGSGTDFSSLVNYTFGSRYLCFPICVLGLLLGPLGTVNRGIAAAVIACGIWVPVVAGVWLKSQWPATVAPNALLSHQAMWAQIQEHPEMSFDLRPYIQGEGFAKQEPSCVFLVSRPCGM